MPEIYLDQDLVDYLHAYESLTGETPSVFIRRLLQGHSASSPSRQQMPRGNSNMALFLRILNEVHSEYTERFAAVQNIKGQARVYFSKDPKEIEASGRSTHPMEIPGTGWWVVGNTSSDLKRKILEKTLEVVGCSNEDSLRWLAQFTGAERLQLLSSHPADNDDPFKI